MFNVLYTLPVFCGFANVSENANNLCTQNKRRNCLYFRVNVGVLYFFCGVFFPVLFLCSKII